MGLLKDQDVLHFKDVLRFFSILHAPKLCRGSVKLFHLISQSFQAAELCHPRQGRELSPAKKSSLPVVSHHLHRVIHMYTGLWPPEFSNKFVLCDNLSLTIIILIRNTSKDYF